MHYYSKNFLIEHKAHAEFRGEILEFSVYSRPMMLKMLHNNTLDLVHQKSKSSSIVDSGKPCIYMYIYIYIYMNF